MKLALLFVLGLGLLSSARAQDEPKPKKEILISINSSYYRNAKEVLEGFLSKQI